MLAVSTMWYYYMTIYLIAAIAGKYREVASQAPPPPAQVPPVQVQLEVCVELPAIQNPGQTATESV